jgi:sec-independent protein translocase protein TatB
MLDVGWTEMAIIALLALVVVGPKDLPRVLQTIGKWVRKARSLTREFQSSLDEMVREAELDEAKKAIESVRRVDLEKQVTETIDPSGDVSKELDEVGQSARQTVRGEDAEAEKTEPSKAEPAADETPAEKGEPPKATIIRQDTPMAPPHSITPPPEEAAPTSGRTDADKPDTPAKTSTQSG